MLLWRRLMPPTCLATLTSSLWLATQARALSMVVLAFEESVKARTLGAIVAAAAAQGRTPGFSDSDLRGVGLQTITRAGRAASCFQHLAAMSPDIYGKLMFGIAYRSCRDRLTAGTGRTSRRLERRETGRVLYRVQSC